MKTQTCKTLKLPMVNLQNLVLPGSDLNCRRFLHANAPPSPASPGGELRAQSSALNHMSPSPFVLGVFLALATVFPLHAQNSIAQPLTAIDTNVFAMYNGSPTSVTWTVCAAKACYGTGTIGPFAAVGAMLEGVPTVTGNAVTRYLYVVDSGDAGVKLYVYKRTDTVISTFPYKRIRVTLHKNIDLPLTGGSSVSTFMAANAKYIFIGTSLSDRAVEVNKSNLAVTELSGFQSHGVTSITSNEYGYVTVTQSPDYAVYDPEGISTGYDGPISTFMLGTTQAVPAKSILIGAADE